MRRIQRGFALRFTILMPLREFLLNAGNGVFQFFAALFLCAALSAVLVAMARSWAPQADS